MVIYSLDFAVSENFFKNERQKVNRNRLQMMGMILHIRFTYGRNS